MLNLREAVAKFSLNLGLPTDLGVLLTVQMIPKSTEIFYGDLADNLRFYKDNFTFYQASLCQDSMACIPMSSTPDRVRSRWSAVRDERPHIPNTPRSSTRPSTPFAKTNMQMVFSPSPLPVSQVPSLVFPEISPPSQGSGSTPFERQFVGEFSREWSNVNTQISPVLRNTYSSSSLSPTASLNAGVLGSPFKLCHGPTLQDSQDAIGRVSLIDRFISAAADKSSTPGNNFCLAAFSSQDRSSPLSDLSDLTSLSSSDFERGLDPRSSSPPSSPIVDRSKRSNIQYNYHFPDFERDPFRSPSTLSSCSSYSDYRPAKGTGRKRKRTPQSRDGDEIPSKRKKQQFIEAPEPSSSNSSSSLGTLTRRNLPTDVPYHSQFGLLYLRFPVSSYLRLADGKFPLLPDSSRRPAGTYNEPRDALDLYTPRFVRGCGATKVGLCPICIENPSRGGKGEVVWLAMKFSAYKWHVRLDFIGSRILTRITSSYHLQYAHGISSVSGRPFSPPVAFRTNSRTNALKGERTKVQEGKCHKCKKWIPIESIKNMDIKVKELYWWKHAAGCHQGTHIDGDDDFFLEDEIYRRVQQVL